MSVTSLFSIVFVSLFVTEELICSFGAREFRKLLNWLVIEPPIIAPTAIISFPAFAPNVAPAIVPPSPVATPAIMALFCFPLISANDLLLLSPWVVLFEVCTFWSGDNLVYCSWQYLLICWIISLGWFSAIMIPVYCLPCIESTNFSSPWTNCSFPCVLSIFLSATTLTDDTLSCCLILSERIPIFFLSTLSILMPGKFPIKVFFNVSPRVTVDFFSSFCGPLFRTPI